MSGNTIGTLFTVTSFGESHGPAIGCVVDGCPPGLAICEADIQAELDRRKPGTSRHVTQRREPDTVEILSGVFEGKTTGTPIGLLIRNLDQRSKFGYYTALLAVMAMCFLGIGMLISAIARTTDIAQGAAFMVWLFLLLFLDLILLGVMIQGKVAPEVAVTLALANPLQVFRTAALALFDPQLIVLGPSAYVILDLFGVAGYKIFALAYPAALGVLVATAGYLIFRRGDLP